MDYLQRTDFDSIISSEHLVEIAGADDVLLTQTEARAKEEMNSYLSVRHDLADAFKTTDRNALVVMYMCDIVLYHLHSRISPDNIPELRNNRYMGARDWLEKVADGFINPSIIETTSKKVIRFGNSNSGLEKQDNYY